MEPAEAHRGIRPAGYESGLDSQLLNGRAHSLPEVGYLALAVPWNCDLAPQ